MRDIVGLLVSISFADLALAGCADAPPDAAGNEGMLAFRLTADYGAGAVLRDMPLATDDAAMVVVSPLSGEATRAYESSDPDVLSVERVSAVVTCDTFTILGNCDHVPTGDYEVSARTGRPGRVTLRAMDADEGVVDHVEVEVREVASFRPEDEGVWRFEVGQEETFEVVPIDEGGDAVWAGGTSRWRSEPEGLVRITSEHRNDAHHAVRALGVAPGEGALIVSGPGGVESSFAIVVE